MLQSISSSRHFGRNASGGRFPRFPGLMWLLSLMICTLVVAVVFMYADMPMLYRVKGILSSTAGLASGFASVVLLAIEGTIALVLVITRITRGHLSPFREAIALACLASICAYAINDGALKHFFGVPNPGTVLHGAQHAFNFFGGASNSSFPSGHMVLASAFAGVFMRLYRTSILPLSTLLLIAAVLLIAGNWHFVSDVIAGTFIGISAGLLAGEVWRAHSE